LPRTWRIVGLAEPSVAYRGYLHGLCSWDRLRPLQALRYTFDPALADGGY
jgi:hypothetical protein